MKSNQSSGKDNSYNVINYIHGVVHTTCMVKVVIKVTSSVENSYKECPTSVIWLAGVYLASLLTALAGLGQLTSHLNPFSFTISQHYWNVFGPLTISGLGVCLIITLILVSIYIYRKVKARKRRSHTHGKQRK